MSLKSMRFQTINSDSSLDISPAFLAETIIQALVIRCNPASFINSSTTVTVNSHIDQSVELQAFPFSVK